MTEPDANGWMPIDSAPKDGAAILVCHPGARIYPEIHIDRWTDKYTKPCWGHSSPKEQPKFWQPLPNLPVQS